MVKYFIRQIGITGWLIITYFGLISPLLKYAIPVPVSMIVVPLAMIVLGVVAYVKVKKRKTLFDYAILLVALEFVITPLASYFAYGQPLSRGMLASRSFLLVMFAYYLAGRSSSVVYLFKLKINLSKYVVPLSLIALYVFNIDNLTIMQIFHATPDDATEGSELKGSILSYASAGIPVMLVYYLIRYAKEGGRKILFMMVMTVAYYVFCAKGRLLLVGCIGVLLVFCIQNWNKSTRKLLWWSIAGFVCVCIYDVHVFDSFMALGDFFGINGKVEDSSVLVRVANRDYIWPVVMSNPVFGVGNLSSQFHPNFFDLFHEQFYVADMGYLGVLLTGGFFKAFVYILFFVQAFKRCKEIGADADIIKYLLFYYLYLCIACQDVFLFDSSFALIIAPLLNMKCLQDSKYPLFKC